MDLALAIELDGGRIALGVVNHAGSVVETEQVGGGPDSTGYEQLLGAWERLRTRARRLDGNLVVCGVAVGGVDDLDGTGGSDRAGDRLRAMLADAVGLEVHADSVGRAFALAEGWVGAARGHSHFAAVEIGQTVRGGIVLDGRLLDGGLGRAGRIGHVMVVPDGRRCACGARGCLQAEASVAAIEASTGRALTEPTYEAMRHVGQLVGRAAASVANLLDVRLVVCGGRVAREYSSTLFLAAQEELDLLCRLKSSRGTRIASARMPEHAGLVGAAAVGWRGLARANSSRPLERFR